jgi:hypothetical protein
VPEEDQWPMHVEQELAKLRRENATLRAARDGQKRIEKELRAEIVRLRAGVPADE